MNDEDNDKYHKMIVEVRQPELNKQLSLKLVRTKGYKLMAIDNRQALI